MEKCEICGKEGFRVLNNLFLCVACYKNNLKGKNKYTKEVKRTQDLTTKYSKQSLILGSH